ncbi:RNA-directed DNA polymerase, eukaryota, reverse transcriptase zinc-binding domain protein [Tanacetum coccineum]
MYNIASWNIRGMNQAPKQKEDRQVMLENDLCVCAILESHVSTSNLQALCTKVFRSWNWTSNSLLCDKGARIILGWNPDVVRVVVINSNDQVMHTCILFKGDKKELFCSFVYAHNHYIERRMLWEDLVKHMAYVRNRPWCVMGDFNVSLSANENSIGSSFVDRGMRDFQECVNDAELSDVNSVGLRFTWNQKPHESSGVLKKIDRIMANLGFYDLFIGSSAIFQPYRLSDHSPAVLRCPQLVSMLPRPFKIYNIVAQNSSLKGVVSAAWNVEVSGFWMYKIVKRLKILKKPLRKLLIDKGNIHTNVSNLRKALDEAQIALDSDPDNANLRQQEAVALNAFNDALLTEERFLNQKAKIDWLKYGDANSAYFHKMVPMAFIDHYTNFLGKEGDTTGLDSVNLFQRRLYDWRKGQVDIQKAYDTVDWSFLRDVLMGFGDVDSAWVIMNSLDEFKEASGLTTPISTTKILDSHDHLYFGCSFTSRIWVRMLYFVGIPNVPYNVEDIVELIISFSNQKTLQVISCKLVFAATCYIIWLERNARLFKKSTRTFDQIVNVIISNVRLKLLSCSIKKSSNDQVLLQAWKLPSSVIKP